MSASVSSSISLLICVEYLYRCLCILQSDGRVSICANIGGVCSFGGVLQCIYDVLTTFDAVLCICIYFAYVDVTDVLHHIYVHSYAVLS